MTTKHTGKINDYSTNKINMANYCKNSTNYPETIFLGSFGGLELSCVKISVKQKKTPMA